MPSKFRWNLFEAISYKISPVHLVQDLFALVENAPKMNGILDKILPYEARAEFVKYFVHFLGNGLSRKNAFEIYLLTLIDFKTFANSWPSASNFKFFFDH